MSTNISQFIKTVSTIERKTEHFLTHFLVPLWILSIYFLSLSRLLPAGVNNAFVSRSGKYTFWVASILSIVFIIILLGFRKGHLSLSKKSDEKFPTGNLILLLLPLTPVMQYILNNIDVISPLGAVYVFSVFAAFAAFFVLFIPMLLKRIGSSQILTLLGLALTFSITNMGELSEQFEWYEAGALRKQFAVFAAVFLVGCFFFYTKNQKILYTLIAIVFLSNSVTQFLEKEGEFTESVSAGSNNNLLTLVGSREPETSPSIYLLLYDAYVVNETMLAYGIDNRPQEQYLEQLGFRIYPHTYSIGQQFVETMGRVLNASTEFFGVPRSATAGDGVVQKLLKGFGYRTYGIFSSDYFFRGTTSTYDYSFPGYTSDTKNILAKAIFTGEFRFDVGFDEVSSEQFAEEKSNVFSQKTSYPKFIYTHSPLPGHSQNSGKCRSNEIDLFKERLNSANLEMNQDLSKIIENDPGAIIIVAGDHGPYLTKNCRYTNEFYDIAEISRHDIQDRFGTFLAIRWPTADFEYYDDITVLQDLFPSIFAYLFKDQSLLKAKIEPTTIRNFSISEAKVVDGIIEGGIHNGEPLFISNDD